MGQRWSVLPLGQVETQADSGPIRLEGAAVEEATWVREIRRTGAASWLVTAAAISRTY